MHALTVHYPLTLYFDGSCPLCTHEIRLLKQYDLHNQLLFVDCSSESFPGVEGHSRQAMMQLIHARDAQGNWMIGPPVFAAAYQAAGFAAIAKLWANPRLQPVWAVIYPWIARNRKWLGRLGTGRALNWLLRWLHRRAGQQALAQAQACAQDKCDRRPPGH